MGVDKSATDPEGDKVWLFVVYVKDNESLVIKVDESFEVTFQSFQDSVKSLPDRVKESLAGDVDESSARMVVMLVEVVVMDVWEGEEFEEVHSLLGTSTKEGDKAELLSLSSFPVGLS